MAYVEGTRNRGDGVIQSGPVYPGIRDARKKVDFFVCHNRVVVRSHAIYCSIHAGDIQTRLWYCAAGLPMGDAWAASATHSCAKTQPSRPRVDFLDL